jgi:hypothetical protein
VIAVAIVAGGARMLIVTAGRRRVVPLVLRLVLRGVADLGVAVRGRFVVSSVIHRRS